MSSITNNIPPGGKKGQAIVKASDANYDVEWGNCELKLDGTGWDGNMADHRILSNRDAQSQHPISSITGLENELSRIPGPVEPITNKELEEMLK